ncbi:MAG TPA: hypothetical protein VK943_00975, partial [Arenibaculum sp.]|nr:hypothetical protein [Arenibaculum sp.]
MPFGAELQAGGGVRFRLWAPGERSVTLALETDGASLPMEPRPDGWHELVTDKAGAGSRY